MTDQSISKRFNRSIVIIVVSLLMLFSMGAFIYGVNRMDKHLNEQISYVSNLAQTSLPSAIWNIDNKSINEILNALFLDEDIVYIAVLADGEIINKKVRSDFKERDFAFFQNSSRFVLKENPILNQEEEIGKVRIVLSKEACKAELKKQIIAIIVMALVLIGVIVVRSMKISQKLIFQPLAGLETSASLIASGDLDAKISYETNDEIGRLSRSFNTMRESVKKLITDLNEANKELEQRVKKRTEELTKSTEELQNAKEKAETFGRYKAALNELSEIMHGGQDINEMANSISRYLADFLKLPLVGIFVKNSDGVFSRTADFGYYKKEGLPDSFELGSGMIGQVAKEKKPITLKDIPEYARITFGFGDVAPNVILVYPLVYNDQTIAVLEFGNFNDFSETQLDWIKQAGRSITLALQSSLSISDLKEIMRMEWDESYDVGVTQFNDHHKKLFTYLNALLDTITKKRNERAIKEVLDGLLKYTKIHFTAEENLMLETGYPGYESHKIEHDKLASEVIDIYTRFNAGDQINFVTVLIFLIDWLKNHIKKTDKSYSPYLNQKGIT